VLRDMEGAAGGRLVATGKPCKRTSIPVVEAKENKGGMHLFDRTTRAADGENCGWGFLEGWEDEVCRSSRLPE